MTVRTITFPDAPNWIQDIQLSGKVYTLKCVWNVRLETWILSINDIDGTEIVNNIKLILEIPLLANKKYNDLLPPGDFLVVCPTGLCRENPGRHSFRDETLRLVYVV